MKRLSLGLVLLIALSTSAFAHEGSIGLYTSQAADDCSANFVAFVAQDVYIVYYRSTSGPDGIRAAEFRVDYPIGTVILQTPVWSPSVTVTLGTIDAGISVSFAGCTGAGLDYLYIGRVPVMSLGVTTFQLMVQTSGAVVEAPFAPRVAICDAQASIVGVLGGYFSAPDGSTDPGVEETSWGAIKGQYK